uniref:Uncharacterized protein n=1 Tax=Oryza nivara TaxID=4536 RepID=A0A0E0HQ60_ORYNI
MTGSVREGKRSPDPPLPSPPMVDPCERETKRRRDPGIGGGSARAASTAWNPLRFFIFSLSRFPIFCRIKERRRRWPLLQPVGGRRRRYYRKEAQGLSMGGCEGARWEVVLCIGNDDDDLALIDVTYPKRDVDNMQ